MNTHFLGNREIAILKTLTLKKSFLIYVNIVPSLLNVFLVKSMRSEIFGILDQGIKNLIYARVCITKPLHCALFHDFICLLILDVFEE